MTTKLILLRHGESTWNKENRFTGWTDVPLSQRGIEESHQAARLMQEAGLSFELCYTSVLKRAIKTLWIVMEDMDLMWVDVVRSWRLNERHYGALQGLNKAETAAKYGDEQVFTWRRSFDVPPPALAKDDTRWPGYEAMYAGLSEHELPLGESLKMTIERVMPYWNEQIAPQIKNGKNILISAHGNSLRGLVKHLDNITDSEIPLMNIPTGIPLVYELDSEVVPVSRYYLGDQEAVKEKMAAVANQAKSS